MELPPQWSGGFPRIGHFSDLAGQGAGTPSLDHAFPRKAAPDNPWGPFQAGVIW